MLRSTRFLVLTGTVGAVVVAAAFGYTAVAQAGSAGPALTARQAAAGVAPLAAAVSNELLYVPVTPCRVVDTRSGGGSLSANEKRNLYVAGTTGFAGQGGQTDGCGVPESAAAVTATFTALTPTKAGVLRAWAAGGTEPEASFMSYGSTRTATTATLPLRTGAGTDLTVKNYTGTIQLVVDVLGYYAPQLRATVDEDGTILDQSGRVVGVTTGGAGQYFVQFDRDVSDCSAVASATVMTINASADTESGAYVTVVVTDSAGLNTTAPFNVVVTC